MWKNKLSFGILLLSGAFALQACNGQGRVGTAADELLATVTSANQELSGMAARHEVVTEATLERVEPPVMNATRDAIDESRELAGADVSSSVYWHELSTVSAAVNQLAAFGHYIGFDLAGVTAPSTHGAVGVNDYTGGTCTDSGCTGGTCTEDPSANPNGPALQYFSSQPATKAPQARAICHGAAAAAEIACNVVCWRKFCLSKTKRTLCIAACAAGAAAADSLCDDIENAT